MCSRKFYNRLNFSNYLNMYNKNNIISVLIIKPIINRPEEFVSCMIMSTCCNDVCSISR